MADYHTVYKGPEGESTKWDDIQRKLGNKPAKEPVWKPEGYEAEAEQRKDAAWVEGKSAEELAELDDEFGDDRFLAEYRRKRLEELQRGGSKARPRFGSLEEIRGSDFVAQVTNAGEGVWVVCHLYKDSVQDCVILNQCLAQVAESYPDTKCVKILSTECIPGYPDANLPTVLLYRDTQCLHTLVGLRQFGGRGTSPEQVAISLNRFGEVCGDAEEHAAQVRGLVKRLVLEREEALRRQQDGEGGGAQDEDSDFE